MPYTGLLHIAVILWGLLCNSQNSLTILSNIVVVQSCARFHSLMLFDYSYLAIAETMKIQYSVCVSLYVLSPVIITLWEVNIDAVHRTQFLKLIQFPIDCSFLNVNMYAEKPTRTRLLTSYAFTGHVNQNIFVWYSNVFLLILNGTIHFFWAFQSIFSQ